MTRRIAIYPGTFDPVTHGHSDIVARASRLFDEIIVAVIAENPGKHARFDVDQRLSLVRSATAGLQNVQVLRFDGLLVDFAREQSAQVILRGLRAVSDFEYEFQLASMNRHLAPAIETVFMTPAEQYSTLSSSLVKEVARLGGDVSAFVHADVVAALGGGMR